MASVLTALQEAVVERLQEHLGIAGVTVLARQASDLESQLEAAVQSAAGLSVIVLDPRPSSVVPEAAGPVFAEVAVTVRVIENIATNETGTNLLGAAEEISRKLHLWPVPPECGAGTLRLTDTNPWTEPPGVARGSAALDLHFTTGGALGHARHS